MKTIIPLAFDTEPPNAVRNALLNSAQRIEHDFRTLQTPAQQNDYFERLGAWCVRNGSMAAGAAAETTISRTQSVG